MTAPVQRLRISHPDLPQDQDVEIDLPWDAFSSEERSELDALDANDDGTLAYAPQLGGRAGAEAQHADGTGDRLQRVLWGYAWASPHNNRLNDRGTMDDRWRTLQTIQNRVYDRVAQPILGDGTDPTKWRSAARILSETGDFIHLYRLAVQARARYASSQNIEYLRIAEEMLLEAKRFAAPVREGRLYHFRNIENELSQVNPLLDRADRARFREEARNPYLMATMGSPITADLSALQGENGAVTFAVAVPRSFITANQGDLNTAIANYFNQTAPVSVRSSRFRDQEGPADFRLTAVRVEIDHPGSADDPIEAQSSYHLDQARLGRTAFNGQGQMVYYRVAFRMENPAEALGSRPLQRFDVRIGSGTEARTVTGGFVVQNMAGQTSHDVFAADLHVNERDYEVVRIMGDSLRSLAATYASQGLLPDQVPALRLQAEEVERFYESINEQVEAAVDQWNEAYRRGEIHRVFLAGDLADFANIARTLEHQGYRSTNVRRLREILGRLEAPLYVVSGNHDHHGYPFPLSLHLRNFNHAESLQGLYGMHYDDHRFPTDNIRYFDGVKALIPDTSSEEGWIGDVIRELSADNPFGPPNDAFLDHHMREIGIYETYGVGLGNGFRVFAWPTETEHFNYARHLLEELHEPVAPGVINGITEYVVRQHVNGKGPRPETFVAFLREMEAARASGQRLILMGHYPTFYAGEGPDQSPDSVDTLRGDAAWAVRMASWYYRRANGEAVMPLSVAGHVHHYGESDFTFRFANAAEENHFRRELRTILDRKNASSILDDLHHLRHSWDLDNRIEIRRVQDPGSDGFPGPIMRDFNGDTSSYCRRRGTAFLNIPTLGVPGETSGYVILTTHPDGRVDVAPRLLRVGPQANVIEAAGNRLEDFRRRRWNEARDWDPSRTLPAFAPRTSPTVMTTTGPGVPGSRPLWDFFPLVYQYPRGKFALTLDGGLEWDFRRGEVSGMIGGQLLFPLTHDIHTVLGGPNYFALGAEYSGLSRDLRIRGGLDWGVLTTYMIADRVTSGRPFLGGEALVHGIFPHAGLSAWGGSTFQGDWGVGLNLRLTLPLVTYRSPSGEHSHH